MLFQHSHTSFSEWKKEVWECFILIENSFPLSERFELNDAEPFIESLLQLMYHASSQIEISHNQIKQFALFVMFLLKSTLFFDRSFVGDMHQKHFKLIMMHADLYLVQGGIEFSKMHQHHRCQTLLEETLKSIATHYQTDYNRKQLPPIAETNIAHRYGAMVFCAMVGLLLLSGSTHFPRELIFTFSKEYGLLLCLKYHSILSLLPDHRSQIQLHCDKILALLTNHPQELGFLRYLSAEIQKEG
jgi:hypothetical protein